MTVAECREVIDVRDRTGVKIGEAFMIRSHPQWLRVREFCLMSEKPTSAIHRTARVRIVSLHPLEPPELD
jgi:predicted dehydrogenase